MTRKLRFKSALLPGGWAQDVCIAVDPHGVITAVDEGSNEGETIGGITLPGMCNVHSHAHQRLMQGLAERAGNGVDSFWTWRDQMYGFALKLSPDDLEAVAAQAYMEMLCAGYTSVGEFQYLHHQPDGTPYDNRAEMSLRCLSAAEKTGIAMTLLPVLYSHGGFGGQPPGSDQRRFITTVDQFLEIASKLGGAIAPHSLRAVSKDSLNAVLAAVPKNRPVHIHVAEQMKEVEDCLAWCGLRPVQYLLEHFAVDKNWCAIHATHMTPQETADLAQSGAVAGLCPTTEANLGDGVCPAISFLKFNGHFAIGSDSHISISPAEELRMLEYSQRLTHHTRNALAGAPLQSTGRTIFEAAARGGAQALQQNTGVIAVGKKADFVVLDEDHHALLGRSEDTAIDSWIFSGGNACVRDVYVGGDLIVKDRQHRHASTIIRNFKNTVARLT